MNPEKPKSFDVYISPHGKDKNDGSYEKPVMTLRRAMEIANPKTPFYMKAKGRLISYLLVLSFLPLFYVIIKIGGLEEPWMGLDNFWSLYKWVVIGSIPVAAVIEYFMYKSTKNKS